MANADYCSFVSRFSIISVIFCFGLLTISTNVAYGQYVVNEGDIDLSDFDLNDGVCSTCLEVDDDGNCVQPRGCTLIAAIQNANLLPDVSTISLAVATITNTTNFIPEIIWPVHMSSGTGGVSKIVGPGPTENSPGLVVSGHGADGTQFIEVDISGYPNGIEFRNSSFGVIQGCAILDNQVGGNGILISGTSTNTLIGGATEFFGDNPGNIIAGNQTGIRLAGGGNTRVYGNRIGIDLGGVTNGNSTGIFIGIGAGEGTHIGSDTTGTGNIISNSLFDGISISGTGFGTNDPVSGVSIKGNYIGTYFDGAGRRGNLRGITLTRTEGIEIGGSEPGEGNIISANGDGIWLNNGANGTQVAGNTIGLSAEGDTLGNVNGVVIRANADYNVVQDNVISGNSGDGVIITEVSELIPTGNTVEANSIGLDFFRSDRGMGNGGIGVNLVEAESTTVGLNFIGGNGGFGILVDGPNNVETSIFENIIGLTQSGDSVGNGDSGVLLVNVSNSEIIGNDIANNKGHGIFLQESSNNVITRNVIGLKTDQFFSIFAGNSGNGIRLVGASNDNVIGRITGDDGNMIAFNQKGIVITVGDRNSVRGNLIYQNMLYDLDLGDDMYTENDDDDSDAGANEQQNFPETTNSTFQGDALFVESELVSHPNATYLVDFYREFVPLSSSFRGGSTDYLGTLEVQTDASMPGLAEFTFETDGLDFISATATDSLGNTSELELVARPEPFLLWMNQENELEDSGDIRIGIFNSNTGPEDIMGVEYRFSTSPNIVLSSLLDFDTGEEIECAEEDGETVCPLGIGESMGYFRIGGIFDIDGNGKTSTAPYEIRVIARGTIGTETVESNESVIMGETIVSIEDLPAQFVDKLEAPFPNPFDATSTLAYSQVSNSPVRVEVYDLLGRRVRTFAQTVSPGDHVIVWNGQDNAGRDVPAGIYFVQLKSNAGRIGIAQKVIRSK